MATDEPRDSSEEATSSIGVVPYSTTVARPLEFFDSQHHSSFTISIRARLGKRGIIFPSSALESAKVKKFGLDLIKRLVRHSRIDHTTDSGTSRRYDEIFGEHVENEGEAQRQVKSDIPSRPATPFPVSDVKKCGGRQDGWKKRFVALKNRHATAIRGKKSSLKTWLSQFDKGGLEVVDGKVVSSKDAAKPLRKKKSLKLRAQRWSSRSSTDNPEMPKETGTCFSSPSLTPDTSTLELTQPTNLPPQTPKRTTIRAVSSDSTNATNATSIAQPTIPKPQTPKRAASTSSLRPHISYNNNLAVPNRNSNPTHPALRAWPFTRLSPTMRSLEQIDERNFHPSLRTEPFTRLNPPFLSPHNNNILNLNNATSTPVLTSKSPTLREKTDLVRSLNIARSHVCAKLLDLNPLLCNRAQDTAGICLPPLPPLRTVSLNHRNRDPMATAAAAASTAAMKHARHHQKPRISTKIETISFRYPDTANAIRLVSPPGLGALACGELWAGGKYKRHKSAALGNDVHGLGSVEQHRFTLLPDFDADGRESFATVESEGGFSLNGGGSGGDGAVARWCGCAEYDSWEAITGPKWEFVGIGRAEDGRWVVELWEGVSER
jgi:hypothetical protein